MDSQMQARFVSHILKFFTLKTQDEDAAETAGPQALRGDVPGTASASTVSCPDVPEMLGLLRAAGFLAKYSDKSDFGGTSRGCRVVIMCQRSGTRVVLDGEGECTCPSEGSLSELLDLVKAVPAAGASRAPSPTPSTARMLEDPLSGEQPSEPKLSRQRTWSRAGEAPPAAPIVPDPRRVSAPPAPPVQSAWATLDGDELNVMAATDLLQEALGLLAGVKKVNLRNTPLARARQQSASLAAAWRLSAGASVVPFAALGPLSRASSTSSSGLGSARSTSSLLQSFQDTPRPSQKPAPKQLKVPTPPVPAQPRQPVPAQPRQPLPLRRSVSAAGSSTGPLAKAKADAFKKGGAESGINSARTFMTRVPSLLRPPSAGMGNKPSNRPALTPGIKSKSPQLVATPLAVQVQSSQPDVCAPSPGEGTTNL